MDSRLIPTVMITNHPLDLAMNLCFSARLPRPSCDAAPRLPVAQRRLALVPLCLALVLGVVSVVRAADTDPLLRLDEALKAVPAFTYGKDAGPLRTIEQIAVSSSADPQQRQAVEQRLLQTLSGDATRDAKEFLCRQLFFVGSARAVPQLEGLLGDPGVSHVARLVLGRVEDPAATAALLRALTRVSGNPQAGILNTLGDRRFEPAIPEAKRLLTSSDPIVAGAAAATLGKIGGVEAVKALEKARPTASPLVQPRIDDALLSCADRFVSNGQESQAVGIYRSFYASGQPKRLRIAGLRGLAGTGGPAALTLLVEAIRGSDPDLRASAIGFARAANGAEATRALAGLLPSLPPDAQELLVFTLGARGDSGATPAVAALVKSTDQRVQIAACDALGKIGNASSVEVLVAAAAGGGAVQPVARASLMELHGEDVKTALLSLAKHGGSKIRVEAIGALASRPPLGSVGVLLALTSDPDSLVRRASIGVLGRLVTASELASLVAVAVKPFDPNDREVVEQAVQAAFRRLPDPVVQSGPVLAALRVAPTEAKPTLLRLLGLTGTTEALAAVRAGIKDSDASVRDAAVRTLADWPDAAPAEDLLALVRSSTETAHKVIALRGYVRMAGLAKDPTPLYARAVELAQRPEDKKLVLGGLGTASTPAALDLVEPYLKDEGLKAEAALAVVQISGRLRETNEPRAKAALKGALQVATDPGTRQQAQELINQIERFDGYILEWMGAGPYQEKGKEAHDLLISSLPPEQSDSKEVKWAKVTKGVRRWDLDFGEIFGNLDNVTGYVRTRIWSPANQAARLEIGSDDGNRVWLNGKMVSEHDGDRSLEPRQDIAKVQLQSGWNELLVKVVNSGGGWGAACRVRQPDGAALEGLKFEAR